MGEAGPGLRRGALAKAFRGWAARGALGVLLAMMLAAWVGPGLCPAEWRETSASQFLPPGWGHPCGTDLNGRDVLFRVLEGARISLVVGVSGALISLVVGTAVGVVAGYAGGRVDAVLMRTVEVAYSVPRLIVILIFVNAFDPYARKMLEGMGLLGWAPYSRVGIMIVSLGLIEWMTMARVVRGQVLALKAQPFVLAARALGASHLRVAVKHLLPNLAGVLAVYLTLTVPAVILDESFLSFLGLGIQAPKASWGTLLSDGAGAINPVESRWWLLAFPALAMSATLLALNFLGDALRDAIDPRSGRGGR